MSRTFGLGGRLLRTALASRAATVAHAMGEDAARDLKLVAETRTRTTLLMQDAAALQVLACARAARRLGGAFAEAGVFAGGSARLICEVKGDLPLHLFDVFETLQVPHSTPGTHAAEVQSHFGRVHAPLDVATRVLSGYRSVRFHVGLIPESAAAVAHESFSFVHLDLDLTRGTRQAIEFFHPRMIEGGIILGDDYHTKAVRSAFDDYFEGRSDTRIELPWSQVIVVVRREANPR